MRIDVRKDGVSRPASIACDERTGLSSGAKNVYYKMFITKCLIQRDRHTVEPYDFFNARSAVEASVDASSRGRRRETEAATAVRVRRTKAKHASALEAHRGRARDARAEVGARPSLLVPSEDDA